VEPTEALESIDTALRLVIRQVLGSITWLQARDAPSQQELSRRQTNDDKRRDGVVVSNDLLNYAYTRELTGVIESNWHQFEPVFSDEFRTAALFGIVNGVRNAIAHGRDLVPYERELISGIAGQLRNQVSLYRSTGADPSSQYYPLIESVKDSFGTEGATLYPDRTHIIRLDVGQTVTFTGHAFNATGRTLKWRMFPLRGATIGISSDTQPQISMQQYDDAFVKGDREAAEAMVEAEYPLAAAGDSVSFEYTVEESDIGELFGIVVRIEADGKYHRHRSTAWFINDYDDSRVFRYAVNPPRGE
jgi:hypothetical protein